MHCSSIALRGSNNRNFWEHVDDKPLESTVTLYFYLAYVGIFTVFKHVAYFRFWDQK